MERGEINQRRRQRVGGDPYSVYFQGALTREDIFRIRGSQKEEPPKEGATSVELVDATGITEEESWIGKAACRGMDPSLFFPGRGDSVQEAKNVCKGCPVREKCLDYAISNREVGIWGGTSGRERISILRDEKNANARKI